MLGAYLFRSVAPASSTTQSSTDLADRLSYAKKNRSKRYHPVQLGLLPPKTQSSWCDLWKFKLSLNDAQTSFIRTSSSAYPTYWSDRALVTLSTRDELLTHSAAKGSTKSGTQYSHQTGALHPLLQDLLLVYSAQTPGS